MDCYIVRIYRRDPNAPEGVAGTVELVECQLVKPFQTIGELTEILSPAAGQRARRKKIRDDDTVRSDV
jgi:hypothetical protein